MIPVPRSPRRMAPVFFRALLLSTGMLATSLAVAADGSLLTEDWAPYNEGDKPTGAWKLWTGNPPETVGTVHVVEQGSPFDGSGKSVLIKGNPISGSGPALTGDFTPTDKPIVLRFDYHIPSSPGPGVLPSMTLLDSAKKPVIKLNLANGFLTPNHALKIASQGNKWNEGDIIAGFRFNTWYRVEISTRKPSSGKWEYDITVTPHGSPPVTVKGLAFFTPDASDIAGIGFSWNSTNPNGAIYMANLEIKPADSAASVATAPAARRDSALDGLVAGIIPAGAGNLAHVAQKIRSGKPVRAGFLGGSITQGVGARNPADSYYWRTRQKLIEFAQKTGSALETIQTAIGGTNSHFGAYRVGVQLLDKDIDLLVVEFAVNDLNTPPSAALDGMEGIVRQALSRNPRMGIVLFYTTNRAMLERFYDKGQPAPSIEAFHRVALHYHLAEVESGPKVQTLFREGTFTPEKIFPDGTHPSPEGHAIYATLLSDALLAALANAETPPSPPPPLPAPLGAGRLARAHLLPLVPAEKTGDWTEIKPAYYTFLGSWKSTTPDASLGFDFNGEHLSLLCLKTTRLRVTGPGFEKTIAHKGNPYGIPSLQTVYSGPAPISGRVTVTALPDDNGDVETTLAGIGIITAP
ncbi:SGNH/GDSL hydrolase family protein [Opitutaceae bacterium TAV4]|nr:SGNH/GDSL hydrolase family protein [Opitutaceae bacterium TAV4]RRK00077.1 SGNH/GDSL hydrolase family protein [Opitutaceae bacterium TAV3]